MTLLSSKYFTYSCLLFIIDQFQANGFLLLPIHLTGIEILLTMCLVSDYLVTNIIDG